MVTGLEYSSTHRQGDAVCKTFIVKRVNISATLKDELINSLALL